MSNSDFSNIPHAQSEDDPYPVSLSAKEPIKFFEAEKGLEILIMHAKANQNVVSNKHYTEVLNELNRIANEARLPQNMQLAVNQLISQFKEATKPEGNRIKVDIEKLHAILDTLRKS